jgi:hypothetical protein
MLNYRLSVITLVFSSHSHRSKFKLKFSRGAWVSRLLRPHSNCPILSGPSSSWRAVLSLRECRSIRGILWGKLSQPKLSPPLRSESLCASYGIWICYELRIWNDSATSSSSPAATSVSFDPFTDWVRVES